MASFETCVDYATTYTRVFQYKGRAACLIASDVSVFESYISKIVLQYNGHSLFVDKRAYSFWLVQWVKQLACAVSFVKDKHFEKQNKPVSWHRPAHFLMLLFKRLQESMRKKILVILLTHPCIQAWVAQLIVSGFKCPKTGFINHAVCTFLLEFMRTQINLGT